MDSNAHSRIWYNNYDDNRGDIINEFIAQNNLIILNNNINCPTFETSRGQSSIDLTLASLSLTTKISNWKVSEEDSLSDHKYILFSISTNTRKIEFRSTLKYNTRRANWTAFENEFKPKLNQMIRELINIKDSNNLNTFVTKFNKLLTECCDQNMCLRKVKANSAKRSNSWWNNTLTEMRRQVNRERRRYQRCRTINRENIKTNYLILRNKYKQLLIESKVKSWREFITESMSENPWGLLYKISKNKLNNDNITELKVNNQIITDNKLIAETLFSTFFPKENSIPELECHKELRQKLIIDSSNLS
jgi:hypothetical protein